MFMFDGIINWFNQQSFSPMTIALVEFVVLMIISRMFLWIVQNVFLKLSHKTETDLDDKLVKALKNPLYFLIILSGLKFIFSMNNLFLNYLLIIENIFYSLIYIIIAISLIRAFDVLFVNVGKHVLSKVHGEKNDSFVIIMHRFVSVTTWFVAVLLILSTWGVKVGPLLASLGVAGVAVAFALQKTLSNIFGGISLVLDKNIDVGDVIDIDDTRSGEVIDIGLRSTRIKTFDNEILIVPSGQLADSSFKNRARPNLSIRVVVPFGVAYGSDISKVKELVLNELKKVDDLKEDELINVRFLEMADSALNFKAYFYVNNYSNKFTALDKANTLIYAVLNKHRIEIPYPQVDVHLKRH